VEKRRGGKIITVPPNETTQRRSNCGNETRSKKKLSDRMHTCLVCGSNTTRGHNSALEILRLGLEQANIEIQPILTRINRKRIGKFGAMEKEFRVL
jgi:transposase